MTNEILCFKKGIAQKSLFSCTQAKDNDQFFDESLLSKAKTITEQYLCSSG